MSDSNWFSGVFRLSYQRLSGNITPDERGQGNENMPGYFPSDSEPVQPRERNWFNSHNLGRGIEKTTEYVQIMILKPIVIILYIIIRVMAKLAHVIYFRDQLKRTSSSTNYSDPIDKANRFIRDLEDNLTPSPQNSESNILPPFFQGSYTQALFLATNKAKFLFVYLTNPQTENSSSMFQKVIINPEFTSLFNDPNVIIWGGDLTNPESYQLANSLNVTKFPFLGLLSLTRNTTMTADGPVKTAPKISLLGKIQGNVKDDVRSNTIITNKFIKKIKKYEPELQLMRNELRDKFISQVLLKQQDLNYQNSLAKDRLKKQQKEHEKLQKEYLVWKLNYFKNLDPESITNKARIAVRIPSGERITQYFDAQHDVVDIFVYVELLEKDYFNKTLELTISEEEAENKFKHFQPQFKFKLSSPVPPKESLNDYLGDNQAKIKDLNFIYPNGLLLVEDI